MSHARYLVSLCFGATLAIASLQGWAAPQASGFIENLPTDMVTAPAGPGALRWESPKVNLGNYSKILLEPLTIYVAPDSEEKGLSPDGLKSLEESFRSLVTQYLEPDFPVVGKPGKGVLVLRVALSNVYLEKKRRGLLSITPVGLVVYAARDEHSKRFSLDKAMLEVEAVDGETGERVAVLFDKSPEKSGLNEQEHLDWSRLDQTLAFYAKRLRGRLDHSRVK